MRINHPTLPHIHKEIPDDEVDRWVNSGWIPDDYIDENNQDYWDELNAEFKSQTMENANGD